MQATQAQVQRSGLDVLNALLKARPLPGIFRSLGFQPVDVREGYAVFEGTPDDQVYNLLGIVHGGYAAALLDSACGGAVHTMLPPGQTYTALDLKVAYHRAMDRHTGPVRAVGQVQSLGRRAGFA
jgi:uncharacterized protein (TIGR00369 family)